MEVFFVGYLLFWLYIFILALEYLNCLNYYIFHRDLDYVIANLGLPSLSETIVCVIHHRYLCHLIALMNNTLCVTFWCPG